MNPLRDVLTNARLDPSRIAIRSAKIEMTAGDFADAVVRIAAKLRADGLAPGSVVGLRMDPILQTAFLAACMHEGVVSFVARPNVVTEYADHIAAVFTDDDVFATRTRRGVHVGAEWLESTARTNAQIEPIDFSNDESMVHLVFSSGTTGTPKGVPFSLKDLRARTSAARDNWMPHLPFFSQLGLDTVSGMQTFFWSLFNSETYLVPGTAESDAHLIHDAGVRSIKTSPAKLKDLIGAVRESNADVSGVVTVEVAGSLLSSAIAESFHDTFAAELVYLYGSTEAGTITRASFDRSDIQRVGRVVPTARVEIVDDSGAPLPAGATGTVRLQSDYQATRYWPDGTSSGSFRGGWFYPGDAGRLETDGTLVISGRTDELINASGLKINPSWVESQIGDYRGISDVACFGLLNDDDHTTELALAFVSAAEINVEVFVEFLRGQLGDNCPRHFFRVSEIPRNPLGKVVRMELARRVHAARAERTEL